MIICSFITTVFFSFRMIYSQAWANNQFRIATYNYHQFGVQFWIFATWTITTYQQQSLVWSTQGVHCTQVWLYSQTWANNNLWITTTFWRRRLHFWISFLTYMISINGLWTTTTCKQQPLLYGFHGCLENAWALSFLFLRSVHGTCLISEDKKNLRLYSIPFILWFVVGPLFVTLMSFLIFIGPFFLVGPRKVT